MAVFYDLSISVFKYLMMAGYFGVAGYDSWQCPLKDEQRRERKGRAGQTMAVKCRDPQ